MTQELKNFKFTVDPPDKTKLTGDFSSMFNEESMNKMIQDRSTEPAFCRASAKHPDARPTRSVPEISKQPASHD
jgi:hypothetical protein